MDLDKIRNPGIAPIVHRYDIRDTILYALGLGYGADPLNAAELPFVYEEGLKAVPAMCGVITYPGFWLKDPQYRVNWVKLLHAEQSFTIHRPLAPAGTIRGEVRISGVEDKGAEKGAMLYVERLLTDVETGERVASVRSSVFLRGDGGQGGFGEVPPPAVALPSREPDRSVEYSTLPSAALLYRLNGDYNPLHADPAVARKAGFDRPILHGLCTFGIACRALLSAYCGADPARLTGMFARFSAPVFPGETIRVEFHEIGGEVRFRALAKERGVVVLDRGSAQISV